MNRRHRGTLHKRPGCLSGCLPWLVAGAFIALAVFWALNSHR